MKNRMLIIVLYILQIFTFVVVSFLSYFKKYITLDYAGILYTFANRTTGTSKDVIKSVAIHILPYFLIIVVLIVFETIFIRSKKNKITILFKDKEYNGKSFLLKVFIVINIMLLAFTFIEVDDYFKISDYYKLKNEPTQIYEENFIDPNSIEIEASEKRNLILIYLESIETSFMSKDEGGILDYDLLPNMKALASDNINFSFNESMGGFNSTIGSTWTMGALFASTTGIPFSFPINGNVNSSQQDFSNRVTCLGDILHKNGYYQEFLCGSDATFGGRSYYYENHGYDEIYDYYTAFDNGIVDDFVWWGFDDNTLYDIAKTELLELNSKNQPFNLTMLTADTHHVSGYFCENCENEYDIQYANVIKCADKQILDFIDWIKEQEFYENTTIVIIGDHPTMDTTLIDSKVNNTDKMYNRYDSSDYEIDNRYVYDCFINVKGDGYNVKNRQFNTMDLFPTILYSIGFNIEGNKIGLGTNLFSDVSTLQENFGFTYLENELTKYSKFYEDNFYNKKD